ncbi:ribonuclease H family protein, partial [Acinetobacter baumannii]
IASPLSDLLQDKKFQWSAQAQTAFDNLKQAMTNLPVLVLPNFDQPFELTTDASGVAIGAVLSQLDHPVAFFSKKLTGRMLSASAWT